MKMRILLLALAITSVSAAPVQAFGWCNSWGCGYGGPGYYGGYTPYYGSYYYGRGYAYANPYYGAHYGYYPPSYYYNPSAYYAPAYYYPTTPVAPINYYTPTTTYSSPPTSTFMTTSFTTNVNTGMQIVEVFDNSPAKKANLRPGDIIMKLDGKPTQTFDDLKYAIVQAKGEIDVTFLNGATMKTETTKVLPSNGELGASVIRANMP